MLKIGQNWGKIANYPPSKLNKDRHPCRYFIQGRQNLIEQKTLQHPEVILYASGIRYV